MLRLDPQLYAFPSILSGEIDENIIAIDGDLNPQRLLLAYSLGIFPWYNEDETPILWQSPNPRFVLFPDQLKVNRSLRRSINRQHYQISYNQCFRQVLENCAVIKRNDQEGTWLNQNLIDSLHELHQNGFAHSAEAWFDGELVGGLYGVALGGVFFGESMFSYKPDASKVAFVSLFNSLVDAGYKMIDCQDYTPHLERFGAIRLPRESFYQLLQEYLKLKPKALIQPTKY